MYKILHKGRFVSMVDEPRYVRKNDNDVWVETTEENAECVSVRGDLYPMSEASVVEHTAADYMNEQATGIEKANADIAYVAMMSDIEMPEV